MSAVGVEELLKGPMELRELKLRRRREGNGEVFVITIPKSWVRKLGGGETVRALVDFKEKLIVLYFKG